MELPAFDIFTFILSSIGYRSRSYKTVYQLSIKYLSDIYRRKRLESIVHVSSLVLITAINIANDDRSPFDARGFSSFFRFILLRATSVTITERIRRTSEVCLNARSMRQSVCEVSNFPCSVPAFSFSRCLRATARPVFSFRRPRHAF